MGHQCSCLHKIGRKHRVGKRIQRVLLVLERATGPHRQHRLDGVVFGGKIKGQIRQSGPLVKPRKRMNDLRVGWIRSCCVDALIDRIKNTTNKKRTPDHNCLGFLNDRLDIVKREISPRRGQIIKKSKLGHHQVLVNSLYLVILLAGPSRCKPST